MTAPSRLALFVPSLQGGGAERVVLNLARSLSDFGHHVDLLVCRADGPLLAEVGPGVRVLDLGARRVLGALPGLRRYLRQERPQALLAAMDHANVAALMASRWAGTSTRTVVTVHVALSALKSRQGGWKLGFLQTALHWLYPSADAVVAVSRGVADDLATFARIGRDRIRVIHNPIVTPELTRAARAPVEHPWFQEGEPPVILGVGRLEPQKDFATLLRAFALLRRRNRARLAILGTGSLRADLEQDADALGIREEVWFGGFEQNPYRFMRRANQVVLSSAYEGFGNVLVEALACGTPVVSTDCLSGPSEILAAGRYGRLVPVGDPTALATAMEATLLEAPQRAILEARGRDFAAVAAAREYLALMLPGAEVPAAP